MMSVRGGPRIRRLADECAAPAASDGSKRSSSESCGRCGHSASGERLSSALSRRRRWPERARSGLHPRHAGAISRSGGAVSVKGSGHGSAWTSSATLRRRSKRCATTTSSAARSSRVKSSMPEAAPGDVDGCPGRERPPFAREAFFAHGCFHSQQAAERALKAFFTLEAPTPPGTVGRVGRVEDLDRHQRSSLSRSPQSALSRGQG